jgi:hypothetical protein
VEIARLKAEAAARGRELEKVRDGFSRDLEKLRETAAQSDERLRATEKRALLEIDRERGAAAKLQKEVDETTKRADRREADHRRAVEALQAQLGDARHQIRRACCRGGSMPYRPRTRRCSESSRMPLKRGNRSFRAISGGSGVQQLQFSMRPIGKPLIRRDFSALTARNCTQSTNTPR